MRGLHGSNSVNRHINYDCPLLSGILEKHGSTAGTWFINGSDSILGLQCEEQLPERAKKTHKTHTSSLAEGIEALPLLIRAMMTWEQKYAEYKQMSNPHITTC